MAQVILKGIRKSYEKQEVVHGIHLDIAHNEFVVLVGPSGCGKSTTLRMIAGLEEISGGEIYIGDRLINDVPPKDRDIAMVFQNYALYPHMTVFENMSFGLRLRKTPKEEIRRRVEEAADILNIRELLERRPKQLSGGQRQRVAMGRAIVRHPQVFLFDEPLSNLDAKLRVQMRTEIKKIHQRVKTTIVYVTHDQVEAMTLADRIVVMNGGNIEQVGTPQQMYEQPATRFVAGFIGSPSMNFIPAKVVENGSALNIQMGSLKLKVPPSRASRYKPFMGKEMIFGIRPEHLTEKKAHTHQEQEDFDAKVEVLEPMGVDTMVFININGQDVCARSAPSATKEVGQSMSFTAQMQNMHLIDPATDKVV
ncbi:MAG: sn-glycerol-3-phosphate ABC transporter ATP-binding protein UgpC [Deltaproteobacteria bacterium]|nr:sn-glycerol-3-phosphate ABC transporter ATP-binding protein UgpC [Deltaproteobacteria bacterium]